MKSTLQKLVLAAFLAGTARAADLGSPGAWSLTITAADLISGAGSDLQSQYQSVSGVTTLSVSNAAIVVPLNWQIKARLSSGSIPGAVSVSVKRSSNGTPVGILGGSISGGTTYIVLTTTDAIFFSGSGNRDNISLQYKIDGVSRSIGPGTYSSPVIFTVE